MIGVGPPSVDDAKNATFEDGTFVEIVTVIMVELNLSILCNPSVEAKVWICPLK